MDERLDDDERARRDGAAHVARVDDAARRMIAEWQGVLDRLAAADAR